MQQKPLNLLVLDVDNTLFDWVKYYVQALEALVHEVSRITKLPEDLLFAEAKTVFSGQESIEYPFLIQSMPSVRAQYVGDVHGIIEKVVNPGRASFLKAAEPHLRPYADVESTLAQMKKKRPQLKIAALTDAPRYVAMWKMNKLGILRYFDAVYGLPDPVLPKDEKTGEPIVDQEIRQKHFEPTNFNFAGRICVMPFHFEKPNKEGFTQILSDHGMLDPSHLPTVLWVGDNVKKDIPLGRSMNIPTAWAAYGAKVEASLLKRLERFSPPQNIHKNANIMASGQLPADIELQAFSDLLQHT